MIRIVFCLLLTISSFSVFAQTEAEKIKASVDSLKALNDQLSSAEIDVSIDDLLEAKTRVLTNLMQQLKSAQKAKLMRSYEDNEPAFLQSRIAINTARGNHLAVQRDQVKLALYQTETAIKQYLEYLIKASNDYVAIKAILEHSEEMLADNKTTKVKLELPADTPKTGVYLDLQNNQRLFLQAQNSYRDILNYVIDHPLQIASVYWFQKFSLLSTIAYVNEVSFMRPVNSKLAPFKIDVGGVLVSFSIILLVYLSYPFVFKCTRWCVESHVIDKDVEQQELIYHEIRRPARSLLVFWGIDLGIHALFYKADYKGVIENFSYVIYSLLLIWLFFKIIDSVMLVQVEKLASANKELRKELFNLGVQFLKGLVVVIVLSFGLNHFGISLTAIMSTLGVGGLAFALAAKDTLSNLFGGVTILFDNVFRMGDWIKIGDVEGTVAEIGLRSTTVRTFDNALIAIPNSIISVSSVKNWNRRAVGRRIKMYVGVTYESDMEDIRRALDDIREMLKSHPGIANPKHKLESKKRHFKFSSIADTHGIKTNQLVFMDRYGDFSIDILIYCFARTVDWSEWLAVKEDVMFKIAQILQDNNLEFAYPTQVRIHRSEQPMQADMSGSVWQPDV